MINIYKRSVKDGVVKELDKLEKGSWINIVHPDKKEQKKLRMEYKIDKNLLKDAMDPYETPRMEQENGSIYIFVRIPHYEGNVISSSPLTIVISNEYVATISRMELSFLDQFIKNKIDFSTTQTTKFVIQIFREINHIYSVELNDINKKVRKISLTPGKITNEDIISFVKFEETISVYVGDLIPASQILKNLLSGKYLKLFKEDEDIVEDILLSTEQLIEIARSNSRTITNIREAYSTIVTNNLNQVIRILTVITVILTIPTIVASIYGMNVALPLEDNPLVFPIILLFIFSASVFVAVIFLKRKWL